MNSRRPILLLCIAFLFCAGCVSSSQQKTPSSFSKTTAASMRPAVQSWSGDPGMDAALRPYVAGDYEKAFTLFTEQYKLGKPLAGVMLGRCYQTGRHVTKDEAKMLAYYLEAESKGDIYGRGMILYSLYAQLGPTRYAEKEKEFAAHLAKLAQEARVAGAVYQNFIAGMYILWEWSDENNAQKAKDIATELFLMAIDAGYPPAMFNFACYTPPTSGEEGKALIRRAAKAGYPPAVNWVEQTDALQARLSDY